MRISNHDEQTLGPGHGHVESLGTRHEAQALQSERLMQQTVTTLHFTVFTQYLIYKEKPFNMRLKNVVKTCVTDSFRL
jgi:hypothetical protein